MGLGPWLSRIEIRTPWNFRKSGALQLADLGEPLHLDTKGPEPCQMAPGFLYEPEKPEALQLPVIPAVEQLQAKGLAGSASISNALLKTEDCDSASSFVAFIIARSRGGFLEALRDHHGIELVVEASFPERWGAFRSVRMLEVGPPPVSKDVKVGSQRAALVWAQSGHHTRQDYLVHIIAYMADAELSALGKGGFALEAA